MVIGPDTPQRRRWRTVHRRLSENIGRTSVNYQPEFEEEQEDSGGERRSAMEFGHNRIRGEWTSANRRVQYVSLEESVGQSGAGTI